MGAPHYPNGAAHFKFVPQNDNITSFVSTNWPLKEKLFEEIFLMNNNKLFDCDK